MLTMKNTKTRLTMKMKEVLRIHPSGSPIGFLGHFQNYKANVDNENQKDNVDNENEGSAPNSPIGLPNRLFRTLSLLFCNIDNDDKTMLKNDKENGDK